MDVRCDECGTEYELDDALATEQGTVVKCTSCGHEFRVFAPRTSRTGPDEWVVQKSSGQKLTFNSLQDLQQAIAQGRVRRSDSFSRNRLPFRPLSSVAELEFFFRASSRPPSEQGSFPEPSRSTIRKAAPPKPAGGDEHDGEQRRPADVARPPPAADVTQLSPRADATLPSFGTPAPPRRTSARPPPKPTPSATDSLDAARTYDLGAGDLSAGAFETSREAVLQEVVARQAASATGPRHSDTLPSEDVHRRSTSLQSPTSKARSRPPRRSTSPEAPAALAQMSKSTDVGRDWTDGPAAATAPTTSHSAAGPEEEAAFVERRGSRRPLRPDPASKNDSMTTPLEIPSAGKRFSVPPELAHVPADDSGRASYRWILALVLIGGITLFLGTRGRKYLEQFTGARASDESAKTGELLTAIRPLIERGQLEQAEQQLSSGGQLTSVEHLSALAEVQVKQADAHWLALRVVRKLANLRNSAQQKPAPSVGKEPPPLDLEARNATHQQELAKVLVRLRNTVASGSQRFADAPELITAKIHFLRLSGQLSEARGLVSRLPAAGQSSERDYLLAMLDIAEHTQSWRAVVERLKASKVDDRGVGHVRAALVFALIEDQRFEDAARELNELERLGSSSQPGELLGALLEAVAPDAAAGPAEPAPAPEPLPSASASADVAEEAEEAESETAGAPAPAGDFRGLMTQASAAKRSGDYAAAEERYLQALEKQPGNVEALTGVAEVYRARGNTAKAAHYYDQAIAASRGYLPALLGRGDLKWESGDRAGAVRLYEQVLERVDESHPYGRKAQQRVDQAKGQATQQAEARATTGSSEPTDPEPQQGAHGSSGTNAPAKEPSTDDESAPPANQPEIDTTDLPGVDL